MKTKGDIVNNWLPRYTGTSLEEFGKYILLTNFNRYIRFFAKMFDVEIKGLDRSMPSATANNINTNGNGKVWRNHDINYP